MQATADWLEKLGMSEYAALSFPSGFRGRYEFRWRHLFGARRHRDVGVAE
jgi:hypothetical protein